jgi:hypothetical protein
MTKLILVFVVGVIFGVLGATSSLFQDEDEAMPTQVVTSDSRGETGREAVPAPVQTAPAPAQIEMPAPEPEASQVVAETSRAEAESNLAQTESPTSAVDETEQGADENDDPMLTAEAEDRIFCVQKEFSGECQCYNAGTMVSVDVSPEECEAQLAAEQ